MPSASPHSTPSYTFLSLSRSRSTVPPIWLLLMLNAVITSASPQCYYPNGLTAESQAPCASAIPAEDHSPCCRQPGLDSLCLTQTAGGLCLNQHATDSRSLLYVGGCTDPTNEDDACPSYCKSVASGDSSLYAIVPCSDGSWCCSATDRDGIGDTSCCNNANQTFRLDWGALLLSIQGTQSVDKGRRKDRPAAQHLIHRDTTVTTTTTTSSSTSSLATSGIPLNSEDEDSDDDDAEGEEERKCPSNRSYIVGLSAGVPLGVCLLAALAAIFFLLGRDRKARERIRQMTEAAREERERVAQGHVVPRLYNYAPGTLTSSTKPRFSHGSTVVTGGGLPPQTPQGQQGGSSYEGYELYEGGYADGVGGGVIYGSGIGVPDDGVGSAHGVGRHVSWATSTAGGAGSGAGAASTAGPRGSHVSWSTAGRESGSWAYEYEGDPGQRKERFEMTP